MTTTLASTDVDWAPLIDRALAGEGVRSVFQPIVDLERQAVAGYEALTRFDLVPGVAPDQWFQAAAVLGFGAELEAATLRSALAHRRSLPANAFLTVNVEPESLLVPAVLDVFRRQGALGGLVVEITEHRPIADPVALEPALDYLRGAGALIAVDDAGSGYAGLQQILTLRPSIVKLDRALVEGVDTDHTKAALVEMLGVFAGRIDAWLLAEGIETEAEAARLVQLGVPLAQGYFFGRPGAPWEPLRPEAAAVLPRPAAAIDGTLHGLLEPVPWMYAHEVSRATSHLAASGLDDPYIALLDAHHRPVGLFDGGDALSGGITTPLRANVSSSPADLAHRVATRVPVDTATPVVVTDDAGRYLGLVTIPRLLGALARR